MRIRAYVCTSKRGLPLLVRYAEEGVMILANKKSSLLSGY